MHGLKEKIMKSLQLLKSITVAACLAGFTIQALAYEPGWEPRDLSTSDTTKVLMLGTGNPLPYPHRSGTSIAVIVNEVPYIFDAGDGAYHAMGKEMPYFGKSRVKGFTLKNDAANKLFITHLHSDHTFGIPAFLLGGWTLGGTVAKNVYGPPGTKELVDGILQAYRRDIDYRVYSPTQKNDTGWRAQAHEISSEGLVMEDENVKVYAFKACHGLWPFPISYRVETPDRVIAISGDTTADCDGIRQAGKGADVLLIEGITHQGPVKGKDVWPQNKTIPVAQQKLIMHSSTKEIAALANELKPRLLVTYHEQNYTKNPNQMEDEIRKFGWKGEYVSSRDGDIF
jgi:ribonuclease Z